MRSVVLFILFVAAVAFLATTQYRARAPICWLEECNAYDAATVAVTPMPPVRVQPPTVVIQKPYTKKTKRSSTSEAVYTLTVEGAGRTSEKEARKSALRAAADAIRSEFALRQSLPADEAERHNLIADVKEFEYPMVDKDGKPDTKNGEPLNAKKMTLTLNIPEAYLRDLAHRERSYYMEDRMAGLARGLAVIVAGLFAVAGYVRLDEWSKGYYSGALKAVAVLGVLGTGAGMWYLR